MTAVQPCSGVHCVPFGLLPCRKRMGLGLDTSADFDWPLAAAVRSRKEERRGWPAVNRLRGLLQSDASRCAAVQGGKRVRARAWSANARTLFRDSRLHTLRGSRG